jgi:hypothetical protein
MFRLNVEEWNGMRSQNVTASDQNKRNVGITPYASTEHGGSRPGDNFNNSSDPS